MAKYTYRLPSAANTVNNTLVSARPIKLFKVTAYNAAAASRFLKLFDKATAPAAGTDTPLWTEAMQTVAKLNLEFGPEGLSFQTGFGFALTNLVADSDTTALTAADVLALSFIYDIL